ncbi:uncharacterized protein LOC109843482 isoform X2 [Asparagus officinalis]|uniref:uncharacterized protein LOC109843482 isoform X2 n=1 Tax=Asparagus officinalis TaxID=4686 RepID=UPI00098E81A3|nr:uncharacterized protein LOC109843482 isoform X2 [Asparagus officinalis]
MSAMEHLFTNIFDRKRWIEDQFKHQVDSYGQSLAFNLLAEGHRPPPCLLTSGFDEPKEFNREQILSKILDPFPHVTAPACLFNANSFFTKTCASNKYSEVQANDELVAADVPQVSEHNSEMILQPEVTENSSKLSQPTKSRMSTIKHKEPYIPPFKKAKTLSPVVQNAHEFTGRVTRSMSTCSSHDYVKDKGRAIRSRSTNQKYHSVGQTSKLAEPQKGVSSVPSANIDNDAHNTSVENGLYLDSAFAAPNSSEITNSLTSRLSAITLLSKSEQLIDGIEGPRPNVNSLSTSEAENYEMTVCHHSLPSTQLHEDIFCPLSTIRRVEALSTIRRVEEADRDPTESESLVMPKVVDSECDSHLGLTGLSSSNETTDLGTFISNGTCHLNKRSIAASVKESQTDLESFPTKLNSALNDGMVPEGSKSANNNSKLWETEKEGVPDTAKTIHQSREIDVVSNEMPEKGAQLPGQKSVCIIHPASSSEDCSTFENVLSNSLLERTCILNSLDTSGHTSAFSCLTRKNSFRILCAEGVECCVKTKDGPIDVAVAKQSEDRYPVGTVHVPLNRIEECDSSENLVPESDRANRASDVDKDVRSDIIGNQVRGCRPLIPVGDASALLPATSPCRENAETICGSRKRTDIEHCDRPVLYSTEENKVLVGAEEIEISTKEISQKIAGKRDCNEMGTVKERITPDAEKKYESVPKARYFLRSSANNDKHYATLKSNRIDDSSSLEQNTCDITWPKRKKMKTRSNNVLATSPRSKVKKQKHIYCICRTSLNGTSESCIDFQPCMPSCELGDRLFDAASGQFEEQHQNKKCRVEGDHDLSGKCCVQTPLSIKHTNRRLNLDDNSSAIAQSTILDAEQNYVPQSRQDGLDRFDHRSPINSGGLEESVDIGQMHIGEASSCTYDSACLTHQYDICEVGLQETMPEFEGFSINVSPTMEGDVTFSGSEIPSLSKERASLLEQLHISGNILEQLNLSDSLRIDGIVSDQFRTIKDDKTTDPCCNLRSAFDGFSLRSHPYNYSSSDARYAQEARKPPLTPPVGKLHQRNILRKSVASSEEQGSNPELVCFRIDENSTTTAEEPASEQVFGSKEVQTSTKRTALADVTSMYQNMPTSVSLCRKYLERASLDSSSIAPLVDINYTENERLPLTRSVVENSASSICSWVSNPDRSGKANEKNRGNTVSEKQGKPDNIVSNVSSFIPLVREKQQKAAPEMGKRDIKIKALEAAEAAKRLEEKRQYEREMKKAAAKLERIRSEQENMRQLELKKKQEDELKKKKEAAIEARKRQREMEKNEKERKRRCTEEARKQQRIVERLRVEKGNKELQDKNANGKKRKGKELAIKAKKPHLVKGREVPTYRNTSEAEPSISKVVCGDSLKVNTSRELHGDCLETYDSNKVVNNSYESQTTIQDRMSVTTQSQGLQSYDITPYKDSDDEDGDEDYRRNMKHVPPWARKQSLNQILLSNRHLDPAEIFARKNSFDLNEVLHQRHR